MDGDGGVSFDKKEVGSLHCCRMTKTLKLQRLTLCISAPVEEDGTTGVRVDEIE